MKAIFPKKLYLNGSDCFHLMLERNCRIVKEGNNQIVYCIAFNSEDGLQKVINQIQNSPFLYWLNNCKIVEPQIGVPYLRSTNSGKQIVIKNYIDTKEQFPPEILQNTLRIDQQQFFQFYTHYFQSNYYLTVALQHVLFDGKGAGLLIDHIKGKLPITADNLEQLFPKRLKWKNPFLQWKNLIYVKKTVERTNKGKTAYLKKIPGANEGFKLISVELTKQELRQIQTNAKLNGVRFGINLYQIACICKVYRTLLTSENDLWFPVPYNGRKRGGNGTIISNYTSFIFHRVNVTETTSISEIIVQLQAQMNTQLSDDLPAKYNDLLQLMRFFPTWFNHLVTFKSSKGNIASFLYSSTEMQDQNTDSSIFNQWILPPFTHPPGLTLNFYTQKETLYFNIAFSEMVVQENLAIEFKQQLMNQLLATY